MTPYEKNCAVAEKLGYKPDMKGLIKYRVSEDKRDTVSYQNPCGLWEFVDYCNDPRDYMKLAIEYDIDIKFDRYGNVLCEWLVNSHTESYAKAQTGHAVVDAFLQI